MSEDRIFIRSYGGIFDPKIGAYKQEFLGESEVNKTIASTIKSIPDWDKVSSRMPILISEISKILNRENIDNALCVPDFILAEMLVANLIAFAELNKKTEAWSK